MNWKETPERLRGRNLKKGADLFSRVRRENKSVPFFFKDQGNPEAVRIVSDALARFAVDLVFDTGLSVVKSAVRYSNVMSEMKSRSAGIVNADTGPVVRDSEVSVAGGKELKPRRSYEDPRNLIPTQSKAEMTGSNIKRLTKLIEKNGFDPSEAVDVWRNPATGRLEIQDGHHRTEAAKKAGLDKIPVDIWE